MSSILQKTDNNDFYEKLAKAAINYIYKQLVQWKKEYYNSMNVDKKLQKLTESNEDYLNESLSKYLISKSTLESFCFSPEGAQANNCFVDIIAFERKGSRKNITVFECKRLPAPTKNRENEYVISQDIDTKLGGIQRFKLGRHGGDHKIACMIGYIQKENSNYFLSKINDCISELSNTKDNNELIWDSKEYLVKDEYKTIDDNLCRYLSEHKRLAQGNITLYHLWIDLQK